MKNCRSRFFVLCSTSRKELQLRLLNYNREKRKLSMKCKNCGGEIRLEELYCPYCGSPNEEAHMHARDMQHYRQEFQKTRQEVIERAQKQTKRAVRIAAAALLLVAIGVNIFLQANSYSLHRMWRQAQQKKNVTLIREKLDAYLDAGDYLGFYAFYYNNHLTWPDDMFDEYYPVYRLSSNYCFATEEIMHLLNHSQYTNTESIKKYASESLQNYYESLDPENYSYYDSWDTPKTQDHVEQMTQAVEAMCTAYLSMSPVEARSLRTLTRGGRALLIERGLDQYE